MAWIYGPVNNVDDIRRINCLIRDEMLKVERPEELTDLKKRSDYLCTLTYSPFWQKKFGPRVDKLREASREENVATVRLANYVAQSKGWDKHYNPWKAKTAKEIEERLDGLDDALIEEIEKAKPLEIIAEIQSELDVLRREFCRLRKAMLFVDEPQELIELKKYADFLVTLTYSRELERRLGDDVPKIREIAYKENERSVELANLVAAVNDWDIAFDTWNEDDLVQEDTVEEYLQRLLEEEKKADTYVPTEARYRSGKTLWLVYESPHQYKGGRVYPRLRVKRVYFPGDAFDITMEGPGEYTTRFGRKVFGVKITYKTRIAPTTIRRRGRVIQLPERIVTRTKIVQLDEGATDVRLVDERPEKAYPVA
ncbi:MAG: hypothetical protein GXO58_10665 [Thermodesulfobacteria bacterium]|nr:hypothetical protein [Thermodesulfobacteriota bacterium]